MKHVLTSAGLVALGATALQAYDPQMTRQLNGRPFSVSGTVRAFYDDNIQTSPDRVRVPTFPGVRTIHPKQSSFGFEVLPSVYLNLPMEQTFVALGYVYSLKWYEDREPRDYDQSHMFNGKLRHQFSPKHDIGVDDTFVATSEPTVVDQGGIITSPTRSPSNVLHNRGAIDYNIWLTQRFGLSLGYLNNWYDYDQEGSGSRSALLDRIEHLLRADARYQVCPPLVALVGYMFGLNSFTGDDFISPGSTLQSDDRDSTSHYLYGGVDYDITAKLRTSVRLGGQFVDYDQGDSSANPYADASLTYVYLPGSSVEVGVRHSRNATDVAVIDTTGTPTLDAETTVAYGQVSHRITHNLTASVLGQYQTSEFNDGLNDGNGEYLFLVGANLDYRFSRCLSVEAGYNYDKLVSDVKNRGYDRNRIYIGVRGTY